MITKILIAPAANALAGTRVPILALDEAVVDAAESPVLEAVTELAACMS